MWCHHFNGDACVVVNKTSHFICIALPSHLYKLQVPYSNEYFLFVTVHLDKMSSTGKHD
jgi:hypothetical protein